MQIVNPGEILEVGPVLEPDQAIRIGTVLYDFHLDNPNLGTEGELPIKAYVDPELIPKTRAAGANVLGIEAERATITDSLEASVRLGNFTDRLVTSLRMRQKNITNLHRDQLSSIRLLVNVMDKPMPLDVVPYGKNKDVLGDNGRVEYDGPLDQISIQTGEGVIINNTGDLALRRWHAGRHVHRKRFIVAETWPYPADDRPLQAVVGSVLPASEPV